MDDGCRVASWLSRPACHFRQQKQGLSSAFGSRVTYLLRGQEISNQQRRPPRLALAGLLPGKSVSRGRAFRQHIHVLAKRHRHPYRCPLRGLSTPTHRRTGDPGRAAGHRGPHSVRNRDAVARAEDYRRQTSIRIEETSAIGQ